MSVQRGTSTREPSPLATDPSAARLGTASRSSVRILLVDDDVGYAEALMMLFEKDERLEVVGTAHEGAEAVKLAQELVPDIVLMDVALPVMDGVQAARRIRELDIPTRVVMLTAKGSGDLPRRARDAGAVAFLTKDQGFPELLDAIFTVATLAIALSPETPTPPS